MAACSQKCVQEHINDLPVRQEHVNRFWAHARYREHIDKQCTKNSKLDIVI